MKKYPDLNIVVEGHTCNIGPAKYNEKLSQRRAEAIKEVLVKKFNINAARIKAKGYGLSKPIASNATKEGRQQNRRVEAAVDYMVKKSESAAAPQEVAPVKQAEPVVAAPPAAAEPVKKVPAAQPVKKAVPVAGVTSDGFMKADKDGFIKGK
jgi:hypothetical protein